LSESSKVLINGRISRLQNQFRDEAMLVSPIYGYFVVIFVNKFCFMDKAVSRICPLDLMMKYVQFQGKMRLSHEVPKVTVELSSSVG